MSVQKRFEKSLSFELFIALFLLLFFFTSFSPAKPIQETYFLGEKVLVELEEQAEYNLKIIGPEKTILNKGNGKDILFFPEVLGDYEFQITQGTLQLNYFFEVVPFEKFVSTVFEKTVNPEEVLRPLHQVEVGKESRWKFHTEKSVLEIPQNSYEIKIKSDEDLELTHNLNGDSLEVLDSFSGEIEVSYATPGPEKQERVISETKKEVIVFSEIHYLDVLASTTVNEKISIENPEGIKIYWVEEEKFLAHETFDLNSNGLVDYIEWNITHLSNQTFEIILITGAEHLDSNRNFIEDIYAEVSALDGIFKLIPAGNFVRVTFEKNLSSQKDITLFAKSAGDTPVNVEVYEKDSTTVLAVFEGILEELFYQVLLTELGGIQDTFDLKVLGDILIDLIIDPVGDESTLAQIYQTDVVQNAATEISVDFDTETVVGSNYAHTSNTALQFQQTGWHKVSYGCQIQEIGVGAGARTEMTGWLELNGVEVLPSRTYTYLRDTEDSRDRGALSAVTLVNITTAGSNVTFQLVDLFGAEAPDPEESCWIYAEQLHRPAALLRETTNYDNQINTTEEFNQDFGETTYEDTAVFTSDLTNNWISVDEDGWYKIYYVAGSEQTVGTNDNDRTTVSSFLYKNNTAEILPSRTFSYHKRADQAAFSSEEGGTIAFLSAGENVSLRRTLSEQQIQTPGETYTLDDSWLLIEKFEDDNILLLWDTSGGQGITGSAETESAAANITWDTQAHVGSFYSHAIGDANFTIDEEGWFEISYGASFDGTTGSNRKTSCAQVEGGGAVLEPSKLCEYLRDSTVEDNSVAGSFIVNNTAGTTYTLQHTVTPQSNSAGHDLIADASWIAVNPVDAPDSIPPEVTIIDPVPNVISNVPVIFNITTNEESTANYTLDGGINNVTMTANASGTGFTATNTSISDGNYTFTAHASDLLGNNNLTETVNFTVDTTAPSTLLLFPENATYNTPALSINYSAEDLHLDSCWYTNNSGVQNHSLVGCLNVSYGASQGSTTIILYSNDSAGNVNSSETTFFVDSVYPLIDFSLDAYASGAVISGTSIYTNVSVTEINEQNITFNLYDNTHTIERTNTFTDGTHDITWNLLGEGIHYYNVTIFDVAANRNDTQTRNITLDNTAPLISFSGGTESTGANRSQSNVFANVSITEINFANVTFELFNSSGLVNSTTYSDSTREINWSGLADGTYSYNVTVHDLANQEDSTSTRTIHLDTVIPLISFEPETPADGTNQTGTSLYANVSITEINFANVTFELFNSSGLVNSTTYSDSTREINWSGLADGVYEYNVSTEDFSGNQNFTVTRSLGIDTTGPVIVFVEPEAKAYGYNVSLELNYTISDNIVGVDQCWWNLDEGPNTTIACGTNTTFNTSEGAHTLYFYSNDTFNNIGENNVTFSVSTTGPAIILSAPVDNTFYAVDTIVEFNYTPTDPDGVEQCTLYGSWAGGWHPNQTNYSITDAEPNYFNVSLNTEGTYLWNVECNDTIGFYSFALANFTVGIDKTFPEISYETGTEATGTNFSRNFIYVNVSLNETNFANVTFELYNSTGLVQQLVYSDSTREVNWTGLADGEYMYNVTTRDLASNTNTTQTRTIHLDTVDPFGTVTGPTNGSYSNNATQNFSIDLTDDFSLANATLQIFNSTGQLIYQVSIGLSGLTAQSVSTLYTFLTDGIFSWFWTVEDSVGNTFDTPNSTITIDTTPTGIAFIPETSANNSYLIQDFIYVNVSLNETNFANVTFELYNDSDQIFSNTFSDSTREINWTLLLDNSYWYNVTTYDLASNVNFTETREITLDHISPVIAYSTGTLDDLSNVSSSNVFVNVSITEINFANVTFELFNTSGLVNSTTYSDSTREINWTGLSDGVYQYNVTTYDLAGQFSSTLTRNITVDTTTPLISFSQGTNANGTELEDDYIFVNVSITEINFANVTFELYNSSGLVNSTTYSDSTREINWSVSSTNISYSYNVTTVDFSGNENFTETRTIKLIDITNPGLTISSPENTTYNFNSSLSLSYNASDKHLDSCWYNIDGGANTSIPSCADTTFSVSDETSHTLNLYANDTLGAINQTSVSFFVNSSLIFTLDYQVFRGDDTVDGTTSADLGEAIDETKSFIIHTSRSSDSGPDTLQVTSTFLNSQTLQFENHATGAGASFEWSVTNGPGISAQRGEVSYATTETGFNISIEAVNLSRSFIIVNNRLNSATANENAEGFWTGRFVNETAIELLRGDSGSEGNISWQVVDWAGTTVESGSTTMAATTSEQSTITAVNQSKGFLIFSRRLASDTSIQDVMIRGYHFNDTTLQFERIGGGGTIDIEWFSVTSELFDVQSNYYNQVVNNALQSSPINDTLIDTARTFTIHSHENSGGGTSFANGFMTQELTSSTEVGLQKGSSSNNAETTWYTIEILDIESPNITLIFPTNHSNITGLTVSNFNFSVADNSTVQNCSLYGDWNSGWHLNQTVTTPTLETETDFDALDVESNGYYLWGVECIDLYGNIGFEGNNTFSAFFPVEDFTDALVNITQTDNNGTGNITLAWNNVTNTDTYQIYYTSNLSEDFSFLNETALLSYTHSNASENRRGFYRVTAQNPISSNSTNILGKTIYYLTRVDGVGTKNWLNIYLNRTENSLDTANETLNEIPNTTMINTWNATTQKRVSCNLFSCPDEGFCTDTNCNFNIERGVGYETNLNTTAPLEVNWSLAGTLQSTASVNLVKNSTDFGKNWIGLYGNSTLFTAEELFESITNADAVSGWDSVNQTSEGLIPHPFGIPGLYIGGFDLEAEQGYEASVTADTTWSQV